MSYHSSVKRYQVNFLANVDVPVQNAGLYTPVSPPKTPVLATPQSRKFSSPIGKIMSFGRKSSSTSSPSQSPQHIQHTPPQISAPQSLTHVRDGYMFGAAESTTGRRSDTAEAPQLPARISSLPRPPMASLSPKRPPPPRPAMSYAPNISVIQKPRRTRDQNKKRFVHEECCLCLDELSTRGSAEKVFELECSHYVHEDCFLLFLESNMKDPGVSYMGELSKAVFPTCTKCGTARCIPKDERVCDEVLALYFLRRRAAYTEESTEHPAPAPEMLTAPQEHTLVLRNTSVRSKRSLNSPKPITRKLAPYTPSLVSARIRSSAVVMGPASSREPPDRSDSEPEDDLESLEIIHIDEVRREQQETAPREEAPYDAVADLMAKHPRHIHWDNVFHEYGPLLLHEVFAGRECFLFEKRLFVDPVDPGPPLVFDLALVRPEDVCAHKPGEVVVQSAAGLAVVLKHRDHSVAQRFVPALLQAATRLTLQPRVPPQLAVLLQLDSQRLVSHAENVNLVQTLRALAALYAANAQWTLVLVCIDEKGKVLGSGPVAAVLDQLSACAVPFAQIRGPRMAPQFWDTHVVQRHFRASDLDVHVCVVSNCVGSAAASHQAGHKEYLFEEYYADAENTARIHVGYLEQEFEDPFLTEINTWMELMETLIDFYDFQFAQDLE